MKKVTALPLIASALTLGLTFTTSAFATVVGGVEIGPNGQGFSILATQLYEGVVPSASHPSSIVTTVGDVLHGAGQVTAINGSTSFLAAGKELDYIFTSTNTLFSPTQTVFNGGLLTFYIVNAGTYLNALNNSAGSIALTEAAVTGGTDWLDLQFRSVADPGGFGTSGSIFGSGTGFSGNNFAGSGVGNLDVNLSGTGLANNVFNTDFFSVINPNGTSGTSDFNFSSSFNLSVPASGPNFLPIDGTTRFAARPQLVPEPAPIALLGFGLAALAGSKKRRTK